MGTAIRPEISGKNKYWIERHRYYELKHFCLQFVRSGQIHGDPTARCAESRLFFSDRMKLVEQAAIGADPEIYTYILRAVTEGLSYDTLKMQHGIPCCRDVYYDRYRRFFWLLDKTRD